MLRALFPYILLLLVVFFGQGLASCGTTPLPPSDGGLVCLVDGERWQSDYSYYDTLQRRIVAYRTEGDSLFIQLRTPLQDGVFYLAFAADTHSATYKRQSGQKFLTNRALSGSLMVSSYDPIGGRVSGTFAFRAEDFLSGQTIVIGSGSFKSIPSR